MNYLNVPRMIQIGSTGRNNGKTTLAKELVANNKDIDIYGLKIITINGHKGKCQRGETGCGICTNVSANYELIEEKDATGTKDTMELLKAGCKKVYLLKVFSEHLLDGFLAFYKLIPDDGLIICESNSIRKVVKPGLFIMMDNNSTCKETALSVISYADVTLNRESVSVIYENLNAKETIQC